MTQTPTKKHFIAETVPGLVEFAERELQDRLPRPVIIHARKPDEIGFSTLPESDFSNFKSVQAFYSVEQYQIPRPKALLGDQHLRRLNQQIHTVLEQHPRNTFRSLHLAAAGSDTSVMNRIKQMLSDQFKLTIDDQAGDLLLRIRRAADMDGWETLVRLTPRPLATRSWRVCDMPGALNATVAYVMSCLAAPDEGLLCNLASGSGSISIEYTLRHRDSRAIGIELDGEAITCALQNTRAAKIGRRSLFIQGDAAAASLPEGAFDALCADFPFGQRVGSHQSNIRLYPALLKEAARLARPDARFVILSHEIRLMEEMLSHTHQWLLERSLQITLRGLHPRLYVLRRR